MPSFETFFCLLIGLCIFVVGCSQQQGAAKFPVTGKVLVNGKPAAGMIVRFHAKGQGLVGQDAQPAAITNENGEFQLSSFGNNDGAAAATYDVTFYWPTNPLMPAEDRFQGAFAAASSSTHKATITETEFQLPPFNLEIPPAKLLPAITLPTSASETSTTTASQL